MCDADILTHLVPQLCLPEFRQIELPVISMASDLAACGT